MNPFQIDDDFNLPQVGLASFYLDSAEQTVGRLVDFIRNGGRFIELAELFSNHYLIWKALQITELQREDLFISIKIWPQSQTPDDILQRMLKFLSESRLKYIDILLVHAPIDIDNRFEQWKSLEELKRQNLARALGLTNLPLNQIMTFIKDADILPVVYMMEVSPFRPQRDIVDYCSAGCIVVINNEPICKGSKNRHPALLQISQKLNISVEELLFRWSITKGFVTLIPSGARTLGLNPTKLIEHLSKETMKELDGLEEEEGFLSSWAPVVEEDG